MKGYLIISSILALIACLLLFNFNDHLPAAAGREPNEISEVRASRTYPQCVELLNAQDGGWCELMVTSDKPGISNVWPKTDSRIRQVVGPSAVLTAWGTAAYDPGDRIMYFMGGGGTDYGGNEVYSFSLDSGKWVRLTDPSPLVFYTDRGRRFWIPDTRKYPAASHLYDGMLFNRVTGTLLLLTHKAAHGARGKLKDSSTASENYLSEAGNPQQYEFNPSPSEVRNGLSPLTWRRLASHNWHYPRTAQLKDGTLILGSKKELFKAKLGGNGELLVDTQYIKNTDSGAGNLVYDLHRNLLWSVHKGGLFAYNLEGKRVQKIKSPMNTSNSLAFDSQGNAMFWDGSKKTYWMNPDTDPMVWNAIDWGESGPTMGQSGRVYGKWLHVEDDFFVGISSSAHGVWVYKHASNHALKRVISGIDIQKMVDTAAPGSTFKLPPGLYSSGLKVSKSLNIDMRGVDLTGVSGGKGVLVIDGAEGPVVIRNFKVEGKKTYAQTGNLAGVRVQGIDFDVTLDNLHITDTALGVMTDNRGGTLRITNSFIGDIGSNKRRGLSHILYAGAIDKLSLENTTLKRSLHLGHILKSRAKSTYISHSKLLGLDSRHSRVVDLSCGGELTVLDSVLQSSSNSDNSDMVSVGVEKPASCKRGLLAGKIEIGRSVMVFDRGAAPDDRESKANANRLFTWRTAMDSLNIYETTIVNPGGKSILQQDIGGISIIDKTSNSHVYESRADAHLNKNLNSEP